MILHLHEPNSLIVIISFGITPLLSSECRTGNCKHGQSSHRVRHLSRACFLIAFLRKANFNSHRPRHRAGNARVRDVLLSANNIIPGIATVLSVRVIQPIAQRPGASLVVLGTVDAQNACFQNDIAVAEGFGGRDPSCDDGRVSELTGGGIIAGYSYFEVREGVVVAG